MIEATEEQSPDASTPVEPAVTLPADAGSPDVQVIVSFFKASSAIRIEAPEGTDPLMVFQLLNQSAQAQLGGLTQEILSLRQQNAEQQAGSKLVLAGPGDVPGIASNLRQFRKGSRS